MEYRNLLLGFLLCCILLATSYSYMILEEKKDTNKSAVHTSKIKFPDLPPISIVELTKTSMKLSRKEAERNKSMKGRKPRIKLKYLQDDKKKGGWGLPNLQLFYEEAALQWLREWIRLEDEKNINTRKQRFKIWNSCILMVWKKRK
ncbi:agouti-signaling protein isoform X1 [Pogona vitticeps]|uniref:Agouti-signaling protein isoform X1 n=1 Tax=Pogona vitticeps TaxID=103695 RepID=A0ABM5G640_9SAUR